jgi:hypothetical protein
MYNLSILKKQSLIKEIILLKDLRKKKFSLGSDKNEND